MNLLRPKRPRLLEWTPPIFGWQYKLHWNVNGHDITGTSWDWMHWHDCKYHISIDGSAHGEGTSMSWTVFFNVVHTSIGVRFVEQGFNLTKAIRDIERQVRALEAGVMELRQHQGKRATV